MKTCLASSHKFGGSVGNLRLGVSVNERTMKVQRVEPGTIAAMLGVKINDRVLAVNGIPTVSREGLISIMNTLSEDDSVEVGVRRGSDAITLGPVMLSALPRSAQSLGSVPTGVWKPEPDGGYRFWDSSGSTDRRVTASQREILLLEDIQASLMRLEDIAGEQSQAIDKVKSELKQVNSKLVLFVIFFIVIPFILAIVIASNS